MVSFLEHYLGLVAAGHLPLPPAVSGNAVSPLGDHLNLPAAWNTVLPATLNIPCRMQVPPPACHLPAPMPGSASTDFCVIFLGATSSYLPSGLPACLPFRFSCCRLPATPTLPPGFLPAAWVWITVTTVLEGACLPGSAPFLGLCCVPPSGLFHFFWNPDWEISCFISAMEGSFSFYCHVLGYLGSTRPAFTRRLEVEAISGVTCLQVWMLPAGAPPAVSCRFYHSTRHLPACRGLYRRGDLFIADRLHGTEKCSAFFLRCTCLGGYISLPGPACGCLGRQEYTCHRYTTWASACILPGKEGHHYRLYRRPLECVLETFWDTILPRFSLRSFYRRLLQFSHSGISRLHRGWTAFHVSGLYRTLLECLHFPATYSTKQMGTDFCILSAILGALFGILRSATCHLPPPFLLLPFCRLDFCLGLPPPPCRVPTCGTAVLIGLVQCSLPPPPPSIPGHRSVLFGLPPRFCSFLEESPATVRSCLLCSFHLEYRPPIGTQGLPAFSAEY